MGRPPEKTHMTMHTELPHRSAPPPPPPPDHRARRPNMPASSAAILIEVGGWGCADDDSPTPSTTITPNLHVLDK